MLENEKLFKLPSTKLLRSSMNSRNIRRHQNYRLVSSKRFARTMKRLPPELQTRILRKIRELLSVNPHIGTPLRGELAGVLSVRIGEFYTR